MSSLAPDLQIAPAPAIPHRRWARSLLITLVFTIGLIAVLLGTDRFLGRRFAKAHWKGLIGPEVYQVVVEKIHHPDARVTTAYLGDSVALQMFWPGHEHDPRLAHLATNQALGVAGQFYLLQTAADNFPNLKDVYLCYTPKSWANNLDGPLAHDYFCQFFHTPAEIAEIFQLKGDWELSAAQTGRWFLPSLLAANSMWSLRLFSSDTQVFTSSTPQPARPAAGEPALRWVSLLSHKLSPTLPEVPPGQITADGEIIPVSGLSNYFLHRMRDFCQTRNIHLKVIPCPCIANHLYAASPTPYDAPIWYLPPEKFKDGIHFQKPYVDPIRAEFINRYHLNPQ